MCLILLLFLKICFDDNLQVKFMTFLHFIVSDSDEFSFPPFFRNHITLEDDAVTLKKREIMLYGILNVCNPKGTKILSYT